MERKTKIVCTIGPASESEQMIGQLIDAGMNVARLNFSHADHEEHRQRINVIRKVAAEKQRYIGILIDTKGPEIRTGAFENNAVAFKKGDVVEVVKEKIIGNHERFHIDCNELYDDIQVGQYILIDDGKVRLNVIEKTKDSFKCVVYNSGILKTRKGVNVPNVKLSMPFISEKDRQDIIFAAEVGADMLALSFVRRKEDVQEVRDLLKSVNAPFIELIAKIENQEGMDNLDGILDVADGVMVARGDLGVEVSTQYVPLYQKKMITKANEKGKPVITATHMLESMMSSPRPTRAEASDVANAILDGSDAIMLSGETAAGEYPIESVAMMDTIAKAIEPTMPYDDILRKSILTGQQTVSDTIGIAVSQAALSLPKVKVIIAFTETGGTARRLCKFRPSVPILAVSELRATCEKLTYYRGVFAYYHPKVEYSKYDDVAIDVAKKFGYKSGDTIVITSGYLQKHGSTNTIRIIDIP